MAGNTTRLWYGGYREVAGLALPHEAVAVTDSNRVIARLTSYAVE